MPNVIPTDERVWVPVDDNVWFRPLLLLRDARLLDEPAARCASAGVLSRHRHPLPVHGYVLKGKWRYLEHDWVATEGSYVYEAPGETHTLVVDPDVEEMITMFQVNGAMIYVDPDGKCLGYDDVFTRIEKCRAHYASNGLGADYVDSSFAEYPGHRRLTLACCRGYPGSAGASAGDRPSGIPGPVGFGDRQFALAWSSAPRPGYVKQEYLPAGQAPDNYESMLLIEVLDGPADIKGAVSSQVSSLNSRRGQDPLFNMQLIGKESSGEVLLDFLIGGRSRDGRSIAEWNGYRYLPLPGRGVMLFL